MLASLLTIGLFAADGIPTTPGGVLNTFPEFDLRLPSQGRSDIDLLILRPGHYNR